MATAPNRFCISCGAPLTGGTRFCGQCGMAVATVAPAAAASGERRQVTILFADLSGYTRLSATLDPEDTHALLQRYFAAVDGVVARYGGTVDKHIGDAVMALFGAPIAHDNDPERAVRAALDMHDAVAALKQELRIHIGLASGEVVAAGIGGGAYTVTGDAVNLAARLCDLAKPGETVASDAVRRSVSEIVNASAAGALAVKGFTEPVTAWRIDALATPAPAATQPLIGRRGECRQFAGVLDAVGETGRGQIVYVRGEAGIGKSRLAEEFADLARARGFAAHKALVLDFGAGQGQDAIRALVRSLLDLPSAADEALRRRALDQAMSEGLADTDSQVFLADLLDLPPPAALRALYDAMDNAARTRGRQTMLLALAQDRARKRPLLLLVEDLHWADASVLSPLGGLAAIAATTPTVLAMTSRIEGDPIDAFWRSAARGTPVLTLDLSPLHADDARQLAARYGNPGAPYLDACLARAEGNPLFLVHLLRDAGSIVAAAIPDSVQSLVLARMDRLDAGDKRALQAAAVIGQRFALDALRHIVGNPAYDLTALMQHYLVRPEGDAYLLAHALIRDGVYASLVRQTRRELHARAAAWFGAHDPALAAEHLDRAEDPAAPAAYLRAAKTMAEKFDFERAAFLAARGFALASAAGERFALGHLRADALREAGRTQDSVTAFREILPMAQGSAELGRAWIGVGAGLRILSRIDEAMAALDEAERAIGNLDMPAELSHIHYLRGNLCFARGDAAKCNTEHTQALELARCAGDAAAEARALGGLGDAHYAAGRMKTARDYFQQSQELCRTHGFTRVEVSVGFMIGHTSAYQNEFDLAVTEARNCAAIARRLGNRLAEMNGFQSAGHALAQCGRSEEAVADLEHALTLARQIGARRYDAVILMDRALALLQLGQPDDARRANDEGLAIAREMGMGFAGPLGLGVQALLAETWDRARVAMAEAETILAKGCVGHNYFWFYSHAMESCLRWQQWGEALRYAQALADYTAAEHLPWSDFQIARTRALAAFGRGERTSALKDELVRLRDTADCAQLLAARPRIEAALAGFG